jgi:hypothetical protein
MLHFTKYLELVEILFDVPMTLSRVQMTHYGSRLFRPNLEVPLNPLGILE